MRNQLIAHMVFSALLISGCSRDAITQQCAESACINMRQEPIVLSLSYNDPEFAIKAAEEWNAALGFDVFIFEESGNVSIAEDDTQEFEDAHGYTSDNENGCKIEMNTEGWRILALWEHELGHCIGLGHTRMLHAIMTENTSALSRINNAEIEAVIEFYGLKGKK